jgi:hypothetical protein
MLEALLRVVLEVLPVELRRPAPAASGKLSARDLRGYQRRLKTLFKGCFEPGGKPGLIIAVPPGGGKTGLVLLALRELLDEGKIKQALIVAPLLVAVTTWPDELGEWEELAETTFTLLRAEDNDPEIVAAGEAAYAEALARWQAKFDAEVTEAARGNPSRASALKIVRARWEREAIQAMSEADRERNRKPKVAPSDFAGRERDAAVVLAKAAKLRDLASEPTELHIINKEALVWLWDNFRQGRDWPYDTIIGDDLREFRSGKERTEGSAKADKDKKRKGPAPLSRWGVLARARKHVKAAFVLTGTPTPKGLANLWGTAYLVDLGQRLGLNKTAFLRRWFDVSKYDYSVEAREGAFEQITGRVADIMFSIDEAEIGELPDFVIDPIRVTLPPDVLGAYKRFEREMVSEEYDVEAVNGGVLHGKLLQFANGSMYREDGEDVPIHDVKIQALKELVGRLDGTPLLVAYTFEFDKARICKAFPKAVVLTPENAVECKRSWNQDKIEMLLAHRASAGHGLNMQKGTGHMCEYGLTSDAELYIQFLRRLRRPGRKTTVFNHVIMASGTIDDDVFPTYLDPKIEEQDRILAAVRLTDDTVTLGST